MNGMTCSSVNLLHFDTMASSLALALSKPTHQVGEVFAIASCWVTKSGHLEANDAQVQILYSPAGLVRPLPHARTHACRVAWAHPSHLVTTGKVGARRGGQRDRHFATATSHLGLPPA
jgi:hypothetical protein